MSSPPRTRVVLIDLDDTLSDHTHSSLAGLAALRGAYRELAAFSLEQLSAIYVKNLEATHVRVLSGELSASAARVVRFRGICSDCGISAIDPGELAEASGVAYTAARRAVPGAVALLRALRPRAKVCVVTNNLLAEQLEKLAFLGMTDLVDVLVVSEEAGVKKPEPAIFHIALERSGARATEAVMLGDSWANDVAGAQAAGIRAVWFNRSGASAPVARDVATIDSLLPTNQVVDLLLGAF